MMVPRLMDLWPETTGASLTAETKVLRLNVEAEYDVLVPFVETSIVEPFVVEAVLLTSLAVNIPGVPL